MRVQARLNEHKWSAVTLTVYHNNEYNLYRLYRLQAILYKCIAGQSRQKGIELWIDVSGQKCLKLGVYEL